MSTSWMPTLTCRMLNRIPSTSSSNSISQLKTKIQHIESWCPYIENVESIIGGNLQSHASMHHSVKTEECSLHPKPSSGFCPKPQFPSSRIDWLILQTEVKSLKIEIGGFECHTVDVDEGNYESPGGEGRNVLAAATALPWPPSSFLLNVSTTLLVSRLFNLSNWKNWTIFSSRCWAQEFIIERIQFNSIPFRCLLACLRWLCELTRLQEGKSLLCHSVLELFWSFLELTKPDEDANNQASWVAICHLQTNLPTNLPHKRYLFCTWQRFPTDKLFLRKLTQPHCHTNYGNY